MTGFNRMISFHEASSLLLETSWKPVPEVELNVSESQGRISSEDVISEIDYPPADRSAVDGYAVDFESTSGASEYSPVALSITGSIEAGQDSGMIVDKTSCCEIFTGGLMPEGSNAVVMAEDSSREGGRVLLQKSVRKFENVSRKGEDIPRGMKIITRGTVVSAPHVASLIAAGRNTIRVYSRIRLGILSTGNEIAGNQASAVRNTTQPLLLGHFRNSYVETVDLGVTGDSREEIVRRINERKNDYDILVVTGGSSLGEYDNVPEALEELGDPVFGGVLIKPGRTISLYNLEGKPAFSVSGLPIAALISFEAFFEIYLRKMEFIEHSRPRLKAKLTGRVVNRGGMLSFLRVSVRQTDDGIFADPLRITGSGILSTLLKANGIVVIPENIQGIEENETVEVTMIGDVI